LIGASELTDLRFAISFDGPPEDVQARHNGSQVTGSLSVDNGEAVYVPDALVDGPHEIELSVPRRWMGRQTQRWSFVVDTEPPAVTLSEPDGPARPGAPVKVAGTIEEGATLSINGEQISVDNGRFVTELPEPPNDPLLLVATDAAGNRSTLEHRVVVARELRDPIRAVHVSPHAWYDIPYRKGVIRLVEEGRINAIQLDLKHESGIIGYRSEIPLAKKAGATTKLYDLHRAVRRIHGLGVPVIGRIVAFRDPILAEYSWTNKQQDRVIQTPGGARYGGYGGFTNFAHPAVRKYNIDVAVEAAEAGVDHILYDYVRRPDAPLSALHLPGLEGDAEASIANFMKEAKERLEPHGALLGASVYGIAVTRPGEISQNIPAIAEHVDYVAPMLYPSHWGPGEYGVPDPARDPYEIIKRSLRDFIEAVEGTDAKVIPWLQDFTLGVFYGPEQVKAQIRAARDLGVKSWILWDPGVTYTTEALPVRKNQNR
jgi:hypothetical protein